MFSILPQTILDELCPREGSNVSGSCSYMASSLNDTASACICVFHSELCSQTVISGRVPESMQWCPGENHDYFQCSAAWGPEDHTHPVLTFGLVLLLTDTPPDSLDLMMIFCTVDDGIFKVFAISCWTFFWNCSTIFRCSLSQIGEPLPIFTSTSLCLSKMFLLYPVKLLAFH